jgi:CRP/FNR family cyclic AMP-dependent transcriptional regulator
VRTLGRGDYLYLPDDSATHVFLVRSGALRLARLLDSGRELNLDLAGPGEIVGEAAALGESWRSGLAQALCPTQVAGVSTAWISAATENNAVLALELAHIVLERGRRIEKRAVQNLSWGCRKRLGALLLELADRFGAAGSGGRSLGVRLTHEDMARFIGAARETVTPLLVGLRTEGAIAYDRQSLVIRDISGLRRDGSENSLASGR